MKKTILFSTLLLVSSVGFAQTALSTNAVTSTNPTKTALTQTQCGMIAANQTATIQLSNEVMGSYDCSTSAAGVGTAHPKGKGKSYMASSNGGKVVETSATADFLTTGAAQSAADTAATAGRNAS